GGRRGRHQVLAVVEQAAVGGVRRREQGAVVGGSLHGRRQQRSGVQVVVALERNQPTLGRELGGPDHVDGDHVVAGVLGLEVLFEIGQLLVGLVGLLLDRHLLVRVRSIPLSCDERHGAAVVFTGHEGDRASGVPPGGTSALAGTAAGYQGGGAEQRERRYGDL